MIVRLLVVLMVLAGAAHAQSSEVRPSELDLTVTVANSEVVPFAGEMVLITIHGVYRRHVTRESLMQPDLEGFNWMQLGEDRWYDTKENGQKVKNFERRMALYPEEPGTLTIGAFTHRLTLTDEGDDWFDYDLKSEPIEIEVRPAPEPAQGDWWFPVRQLRVSDEWSNAPDQLQRGEGVLRVIKIEAVGASPEMIPPMPKMTSPSAMIFPHPEKRFVELSPEGPVTYAFWRWTVRPTNDTSAILEPIRFSYYDTRARKAHEVTISAQRVAFEDATLVDETAPAPPEAGRLLRGPLLAALAAGFALGLLALLGGRRFAGRAGVRGVPYLDPLDREIRAAGRKGDLRRLRRAAAALLRRDGGARRRALLDDLDRAVFAPVAQPPDPRDFARAFLAARPEEGTAIPGRTEIRRAHT